jgi:pimeloyl-ACP methyl ester carboxylesterase
VTSLARYPLALSGTKKFLPSAYNRRMTSHRLACASARSRRLRASGLSLHLLEWGSAGRPALCFLHGGAAHAHWFDEVTGCFADRFHVVALDQRGHGLSDWPATGQYATEDFAGDLLAVMDALEWRDMVVVGHSMGGHNAMSFAAWHPERVRGLVIVDARPSIPDDRLVLMHRRGQRALRHHATIEEAVKAFRLLPRETVADPALLEHMAREGVAERGGGWVYRFDPTANAARKPVDAWTLLDRIQAPTLIARAELSPVLPPAHAERLRDAIRGAVLVEIAGSYHHVTLDQPAAFAAALERFLG